MTLKFDRWPCKTIGHLFCATSSFLHHFVAIGEFKLELQSGNPNLGQISTIFSAVWPWNLTDDLKKQCYFKLCASSQSHLQSGNTQSGSNSMNVRAMWPWNLMDDLEKQYGTSPKQNQAICIISSSYGNLNWSCSPETVKWGVYLCDLDLWPLTLPFCSLMFHDDGNIVKKVWRMDRQTDRRTEPFIELFGRS